MFLDRLLRRKIMHNNAAKKVMFPEEKKRAFIFANGRFRDA